MNPARIPIMWMEGEFTVEDVLHRYPHLRRKEVVSMVQYFLSTRHITRVGSVAANKHGRLTLYRQTPQLPQWKDPEKHFAHLMKGQRYG